MGHNKNISKGKVEAKRAHIKKKKVRESQRKMNLRVLGEVRTSQT